MALNKIVALFGALLFNDKLSRALYLDRYELIDNLDVSIFKTIASANVEMLVKEWGLIVAIKTNIEKENL